MSIQNETTPLGSAGLYKCAFPGGNCSSNNAPKSALVQQTVADLQRDYIAEALRIASLKASHAADDIAIGDDLAAERGIRIAVQNLREAATTFRELQRLIRARATVEREVGQ